MSRILLVEDDMLLRPLMTRVLLGAGYEVVDVGSVREALVQRGPWDLLILDQVLPNGEGRRVAEHFRDTVTLFATGYASQVAGEPNLLLKPFTATEFLRRVRALVAPPPPAPA